MVDEDYKRGIKIAKNHKSFFNLRIKEIEILTRKQLNSIVSFSYPDEEQGLRT